MRGKIPRTGSRRRKRRRGERGKRKRRRNVCRRGNRRRGDGGKLTKASWRAENWKGEWISIFLCMYVKKMSTLCVNTMEFTCAE